jgi:hypothetical protein
MVSTPYADCLQLRMAQLTIVQLYSGIKVYPVTIMPSAFSTIWENVSYLTLCHKIDFMLDDLAHCKLM